jgi:hypothetical protein
VKAFFKNISMFWGIVEEEFQMLLQQLLLETICLAKRK